MSTQSMNILLVGSGGREHALAWKMAQSPLLGRMVAAPGNPGIAQLCETRPVKAADVEGLVALAQEIAADLVVVGPESALEVGLADRLAELNIPCFGPTAAAAQLETSKAFTKQFCDRHGLPTAGYGVFEDAVSAKAYLNQFEAPYVIKADGLAAGKGVVIAESRAEADAAIDDMLGGRFGAAGARVVIEEFMTGEEASLFALCDGETAMLIGAAQDHKRAFDGDQGPNTGGMGTYSPPPVLTAASSERELVAGTSSGGPRAAAAAASAAAAEAGEGATTSNQCDTSPPAAATIGSASEPKPASALSSGVRSKTVPCAETQQSSCWGFAAVRIGRAGQR